MVSNILRLRDGQEALDYLVLRGEFKNRSEFPLPKLVSLDINLPKRNGLEVLACLKDDSSLRSIPVVLLTSSLLPSDMSATFIRQVDSYVQKPLDYQTFEKILKKTEDIWYHWNTMNYCTYQA